MPRGCNNRLKALRLQTLLPLSELSLFTITICFSPFLMQACRKAFCWASGYTPYLVTSSRRQCSPCMLLCISSIFLCWEIAQVPFSQLRLFSWFFVLPSVSSCGYYLALSSCARPECISVLDPTIFYFIYFNPSENSMSPDEFSLLLPHFCDFTHPFSLLIVVGLPFVRLSALTFYLGDRWKSFSLFFSCISKIDA